MGHLFQKASLMLLKKVRTHLTHHLWHNYKNTSSHAHILESALQQRDEHPILDHYAIIDLPSIHTGIPTLSQIFSMIGYCHQGSGYLPEKQNDFIWMSEADAHDNDVREVLPQVVLADFRLAELPQNIRSIIEKYTRHSHGNTLLTIKKFAEKTKQGDQHAAQKLTQILNIYLTTRDWPLPTKAEINTVSEVNELLAWTLLFGRRPNHFTISAHLLNDFNSLEEFNTFVTDQLDLRLNSSGGIIKGSESMGIKQSSTLGLNIKVPVADGHIEVPESFIEFVWRYQNEANQGSKWHHYFTGFIANNANHVIESLYKERS